MPQGVKLTLRSSFCDQRRSRRFESDSSCLTNLLLLRSAGYVESRIRQYCSARLTSLGCKAVLQGSLHCLHGCTASVAALPPLLLHHRDLRFSLKDVDQNPFSSCDTMEIGSDVSIDYRQETYPVAGRPKFSNHSLTEFPGASLPTSKVDSLTPDGPSNRKLPAIAGLNRIDPVYTARQPWPSTEAAWPVRPSEPTGTGCNHLLCPQSSEPVAPARTTPDIPQAFGKPWGNCQNQCGYIRISLGS